MKEILYGYPGEGRHIAGKFGKPIHLIGDAGENGKVREWERNGEMSEVSAALTC